MFFPEYFMQFAHPVLFIESMDLSTPEILNFPFMMEVVLSSTFLFKFQKPIPFWSSHRDPG